MRRKFYFLSNADKESKDKLFEEYLSSTGQYYVRNIENQYSTKCREYDTTLEGFRSLYKDIKRSVEDSNLLLLGDAFTDGIDSSQMDLSLVNTRLSNTVVLEFTNYLIPKLNCDNATFSNILLRVIDSLPPEFRDVSCIAIAKPEFGLNVDNIECNHHFVFSGYLLFWLDNHITADMINKYLKSLNFRSEYPYCRSLRTEDNKNEVQYCISSSASYPNYTVKLCTPTIFNQSDRDKISFIEDRVILFNKPQLTLPVSNSINKYTLFMNLKGTKFLDVINEHLTNNMQDTVEKPVFSSAYDFTILKDKQKLINRSFSRNADLFTNSYCMNVHKKAKPFKLKYITDLGDFAVFSAGTSNRGKYYCYRYDPYYLIPIDNGCAFIFEQVDPETYKYHLYYRIIHDGKKIPSFLSCVSDKTVSFAGKCGSKLLAKMNKKNSLDVLEPVSYICRTNGGLVLGLQSKKYKKFHILERLPEGKRMSVAQWYRQMRRYSDENINEKLFLRLETIFDPSYKSGIDYERNICNLFHPTPYMLLKAKGNERITIEKVADKIAKKCPKIETLVHSVTGGLNEALMFHLWLAKIMQEKRKVKLAWVLQGIQGTGKGLLADLVLKVLFGEYFFKCGVSMFDDRFDEWKDNALIVFVDEYSRHAHDKKALSKARIKELITEDDLSSRKMFTSSKIVKNYANYIFATNISDAVEIEPSDRRFNVGVWQSIRFDDFYAMRFNKQFVYSTFVNEIIKELEDYARILNIVDYGYVLDKALNNPSKMRMAKLSETAEETFVRLLTRGDFLGLSVVFEYEDTRSFIPASQIVYATWIICILDLFKACKYTKKAIENDGKSIICTFELPVFKTEICLLFSAFLGKHCTFKKLDNVVQYMFPTSKRYSRTFCGEVHRKRGYLVSFQVDMPKLYELIADNQFISNRISELRKTANAKL